MQKIYRHPTQPVVDIPQVDLLTLLFDSEHGLAEDDTVVHADATNPSHHLTKAELRSLLQRVAHGLRHGFGIGAQGPGRDVVTVISYGQVLVGALFGGVIAAGGVYSAASPTSTTAELARQVSTSKSSLIVCGAEQAVTAREAAVQCGLPPSRVLLMDSEGPPSPASLRVLDPQPAKAGAPSSAVSPPGSELTWQRITDPVALRDSLIIILWSSGTTGLPKGVMLSHLNLVAETYLTSLSGRQVLAAEVERVGGLENMPPMPQYRTIAHLPISHIAGLFGYMIHPLYSGGTAFWMRRYRWAELLEHATRHEITYFYTVPSIYLRIAKAAASPDEGEKVRRAFANVLGASTGAAPMDGALQTAANKQIGSVAAAAGAAVHIGQTWGLSETTGAVTAQPAGADPDVTGSISPPLPCVELRLVDADMRDVADPAREPGELLVRAPMVTRGYFGNEQATRDSFHDGWFRSGDLAVLREGKFYIVDRMKEILKYKGIQIAPAELENLLFTHPAVREAAVVGVPSPDDATSDLPRAYVVIGSSLATTATPKSSSPSSSSPSVSVSSVSEREIQDWVAARVAPHKQLRGGVVFVDEIPKNAVGKFLRRELRDRAKREMAAGGQGGRGGKL